MASPRRQIVGFVAFSEQKSPKKRRDDGKYTEKIHQRWLFCSFVISSTPRITTSFPSHAKYSKRIIRITGFLPLGLILYSIFCPLLPKAFPNERRHENEELEYAIIIRRRRKNNHIRFLSLFFGVGVPGAAPAGRPVHPRNDSEVKIPRARIKLGN